MSNLKTIIQHNKNKIILVLTGICTIGIGFGLYKIISSNNNELGKEDENLGEEIRVADYLLGANKDGKIELLGVKDGTILNEFKLKETNDYIYYMNNSLDKLYAFNNKSKTLSKIVEEDKKIKVEENILIVTEEISNTEKFVCNDNFLVTLSKDKKSLTKVSKDGKVKVFSVKEEIDNISIIDDYIVFNTKDKIYNIDLNTNKLKSIEIGDKTTGLFIVGDKIIAFNKFGSDLNNSIALTINPQNLNIQHLQKFNSGNISGLKPDSDDTSLTYSDLLVLGADGENKTMTQSITTVEKDTYVVKKDKTKTPQNVKDFKYDSINTISSKGYMYSKINNKYEIVDIRSGEIFKIINTSNNVIFPILK